MGSVCIASHEPFLLKIRGATNIFQNWVSGQGSDRFSQYLVVYLVPGVKGLPGG